jgi:hypothetical protein
VTHAPHPAAARSVVHCRHVSECTSTNNDRNHCGAVAGTALPRRSQAMCAPPRNARTAASRASGSRGGLFATCRLSRVLPTYPPNVSTTPTGVPGEYVARIEGKRLTYRTDWFGPVPKHEARVRRRRTHKRPLDTFASRRFRENSFADSFGLIEVSVARRPAGKNLRVQLDGIAA